MTAVGDVLGRLTVLAVDRITDAKTPHTRITVRCECGTVKTMRQGNLGNSSLSCGCARKQFSLHRSGHTVEYKTWSGMKSRCYNPRVPSYANYGARGIAMCDRWRDSFLAFLADMGHKPEGMTIERINNDGDYEPSNCKWATKLEQGSNQSQNNVIEALGLRLIVTEWARRTGISRYTLAWRIARGWTPEETVCTPARPRRPNGTGTKRQIAALERRHAREISNAR